MVDLNRITGSIVDCAYRIHAGIGPGLFESVHEVLMARDLTDCGHDVSRQKLISFEYKGIQFDEGFRVDLIVDSCVVVEIKSVEKLAPVHEKQLLTYLRLLDYRVGLLLNFGAPCIRDGIRRVVNKF